MSARLEFVDTNILLYAYDHSEPIKQAKAQAYWKTSGSAGKVA